MKTVLRDVKTGLLFRHMDEWTSSVEEAAGFRDILTALEFCQRHNLHGVAILHVFGGGTNQRVVAFYRRPTRPISSTTSSTVPGEQLPLPRQALNNETRVS